MAFLIRRDNREQRAQDYGLEPFRSWDPFRVMDALLRWEPSQETRGFRGVAFAPHFDVKETKDGYLFRADMPGVKEGDLEISVTGNVLTVSGKREEDHRDEGEQYFTVERSHGQFTRSFSLPESADVNGVSADLKDGVLTLQIAKKPETQPRRIKVGNGAGPKA
jgi:HSP20 family protein